MESENKLILGLYLKNLNEIQNQLDSSRIESNKIKGSYEKVLKFNEQFR